MGCCASTHTRCRSPTISASKSQAQHCNSISKSPPSTHQISEQEEEEEEETVKEVLAETPNHFPGLIVQHPRPIFPLPDFSILPHQKRPQIALRRNHTNTTSNNKDNLLEICTNPTDSTAISTAMAVTREINAATFRQRSPIKSNNRTFPGEVKRERIAGMSPSRRSETSPIRSGSGRKRDNGEVSGRRSRSPVLRTTDATPAHAALTRTQSARNTGRSPGRVHRKMEGEKQDEWPPTGNNESLENPLVSLECFIFL